MAGGIRGRVKGIFLHNNEHGAEPKTTHKGVFQPEYADEDAFLPYGFHSRQMSSDILDAPCSQGDQILQTDKHVTAR